MNKLQQIVNNKWFLPAFFGIAVLISLYQHYRVFSLDIIGYHSWRQTQTQTVIENFANEDFNILNPRLNDLYYKDRIYRMEFPLAQWLIATLMKCFGNHIILSRLFFYTVTLFSTFGIYKLIDSLTSHKLSSALSAWFFLCSPIIYYYSVNPMPDNLALCFGIWMTYFWISYLKTRKHRMFFISCLFFGLSMAVKLPFVLFGGMYLSECYIRSRPQKFKVHYMVIPFLFCIPAVTWYALVISTWHGNGIVKGIFDNQLPMLRLWDIFSFHLISTLPELLVNYATFPLFVIGLYLTARHFTFTNSIHRSFFYVGCLCMTYFFYELNMIEKVHDYYLFPFLPLLFVIVAKALFVILSKPFSNLNYLILVSFLLCPVTAYLRCNTRWNSYSPGFSRDYLMYKYQLQNIIPDSSTVLVHADDSRCIVLYHLHRKGWSYGEDGFTDSVLVKAIRKGADYFITDTKTDHLSLDHYGTLLFKRQHVKLYKLK